MLRPKQMSKVSVTGSKQVMESVVENVHEMNLLHVSEYDGSWEGFQPGNPEAEAEDASDKLVTVRSIESILDIEGEDADTSRIVTDDSIESELEEVRERVNSLDDRRDELRDELRKVEERLAAAEPFVDLGIDLNLLSGYDSLQVAVGEGDEDELERALLDADGVDQYEIFTGGDVVALFVHPSRHAGDEAVLQDALVGTSFTGIDVPDVDGSPESYVRELQGKKQELESDLQDVESDLEDLKLDFAGFLLAAEEKLSIDVQKAEAPLSFATTQNAFVAEGWIPTEEYTTFNATLTDELGDRVEVEEVERASFKSDGEAVHEHPTGAGAAATDGGHVEREEPPVIQNNSKVVQPFEVLVKAIARPGYREFDPTMLMFLTFPVFFGFMIGDLGYGLIYTAIGAALYMKFDNPAIKSMGGVTIAAGVFTAIFGVLYGELFGLHVLGEWVFGGDAPMHKGLQPAYINYAKAWIVVSALAALVHLNIGYILGFIEELEFHGFMPALYEKGSWLLGMNGLWLFIFSKVGSGPKPDFIFEVFNKGSGAAYKLGFAGFSEPIGYLGLGLFVAGLLLLLVGAPAEAVEIFDTLVNVLSYARLSAVLLAKAGMAFAVNLLFFGVAVTGEPGYEKWHFMTKHAYHVGDMYHGHEVTAIMFPGLMHGGAAMLVIGLLVLVFGHLLVLLLGVTSAGLQAVRLEYYEFFSKFFEGGGREYEPFGYERTYTKQD